MSSNSVFALVSVLVFLTFALERALREARRQREAREVLSLVELAVSFVPVVHEYVRAAGATRSCVRRCTQPVPSYFDAFLAAKPSSGGPPCSS